MKLPLFLLSCLCIHFVTAAPGHGRSRLQDRIVLYPHLMAVASGSRVNALNDYSRIVEGQEVVPHNRPYVVKVVIDDKYFCGGALVADNTVLTAAHCLDDGYFTEVTAGAHDQSINEATQQKLSSSNLIVHEDWQEQGIHNDIAAIILSTPFELNENVQPIVLGPKEPGVHAVVGAAGWGVTSDAPFTVVNDVLMEVFMPIIDDIAAGDFYGNTFKDWDQIVCTDSNDGGTCNGDSGGPLFLPGATSAEDKLVGLTSFGASSGCSRNHPDCFTSIEYHLVWIKDNTDIEPPATF